MDYVEQAGIRIAKPLYDFVNSEALPGTSIGADAFWSGFAALLDRPGAALQGAAGQARRHAAADRRLAPRQQAASRPTPRAI